jgi:hypothetical protein
MLKDPAFRRNLMEAKDAEGIMKLLVSEDHEP